ncbi:MAG: hypothetical protein KBC48_00150 [Candidatus Pacebacteria bacterium]|nr:hypothetical protein [Candidatus Paceibacterota bacterium]
MSNKTVLGIDFGWTICKIINGRQKNLAAEMQPNFLENPFVDGAPEVIKELVEVIGAKNMHIVSKADLLSEIHIKDWLRVNGFWTLTGMIPYDDHLHFCRERKEKAAICEKLGITHFIDDRLEVLYHLRSVPTRLALNPRREDPDEVPFFRKMKDEDWGSPFPIQIAQNWIEAKRFIFLSML